MRRTPLAWQVTILVALLSMLSLAVLFAVIERSTTGRLVGQIDQDLTTQAREWDQFVRQRPFSDAASLERTARAWLRQQRGHPASQIQVVQVVGGPVLSNQPTLVQDSARLRADPPVTPDDPWLLSAPAGISIATVDGTQHLRELTVPLVRAGRQLGTLRVADSLLVVDRAKASLRHDLLTIGLPIGLVGALAAGTLAGLLLRPLRRVVEVATGVDGGNLAARAGVTSGPDEVRRVGGALDGMLDRIEETIERERRFVSDASHELRTPLAVLRTQAESLLRERDPDALSAGLREVTGRVDGLSSLVSDLLTLAAADEGPSRVLETRPVDLADYAADLERDLPLFGDRRWRVQAVGGTLVADPHRLDQVLRNLVANAVRHTDPDGVVSIAFTEAAPGWLRVEVTDHGTGMSADEVERAFDRFGRGTGQARHGGTGLGLPICRALVRAHGGRIGLESEPGRGTTARVELPGFTALTDS